MYNPCISHLQAIVLPLWSWYSVMWMLESIHMFADHSYAMNHMSPTKWSWNDSYYVYTYNYSELCVNSKHEDLGLFLHGENIIWQRVRLVSLWMTTRHGLCPCQYHWLRVPNGVLSSKVYLVWTCSMDQTTLTYGPCHLLSIYWLQLNS